CILSTYFTFSTSIPLRCFFFFFFFNHTATTDIYTLSLHDALPISSRQQTSSYSAYPMPCATPPSIWPCARMGLTTSRVGWRRARSEEHTSELQSPYDLVCRLLLEKKKKTKKKKTRVKQC